LKHLTSGKLTENISVERAKEVQCSTKGKGDLEMEEKAP